MTTMKALLLGTLIAGTTVGVAGCGPVVPVSPTWANDVRPLVVARCVRCHDVNPDSPTVGFNGAPYSLNFADVAMIPTGTMGSLKAKLSLAIRGNDTVGKTPLLRMPPPPSAKLEDWQIETFESWIANPM